MVSDGRGQPETPAVKIRFNPAVRKTECNPAVRCRAEILGGSTLILANLDDNPPVPRTARALTRCGGIQRPHRKTADRNCGFRSVNSPHRLGKRQPIASLD